MNEEVTEYKAPKWFKIIIISYISLGLVFFLVFLGLILFVGDNEVIELGQSSYDLMTIAGGSLMIFSIVGVPVLGLLHHGLKNQNKTIRYALFAAAASWGTYFIVQFVRMMY